MEIWKEIKDYEGKYEVSSLGRIKSLNYLNSGKEKIMKTSIGTQGYPYIFLSKNGKKKCFTIHKLVAIAFLNHIPNGFESVIDHKNSDKTENTIQNLRIVTHRENISKEYKEKRNLPTGVRKWRNKYKAQIKIKGKLISLGLYLTQEEASNAYQQQIAQLNN